MKHMASIFGLSKASLYVAILLWGIVSFGITPTFGSLIVHFTLTPLVIWAFASLCHWEGWHMAQLEFQREVAQHDQDHQVNRG